MSWSKGSFIVRGGNYDRPSDMLVGDLDRLAGNYGDAVAPGISAGG
jgi:hypothetical protein